MGTLYFSPLSPLPLPPTPHEKCAKESISTHSPSKAIDSSMAVQAHYPSMANTTNHQQHNQQQQQPPPPLFFSSNGRSSKKRLREGPPPMGQTQNPPSISTGLRLSVEDSAFFSDELLACVSHQRDELDRFLLAQGEQLRRTLAEKRQQHYRALMAAAEESAARRMGEKQAELDRAVRRGSELEERLVRLRTETLSWHVKAMAEQATAASLHAQLQQAAAAQTRPTVSGDHSPAEDAESAYVDPDRSDPRTGLCRSCRSEPVSVVLLPCRHLCLCNECGPVTAGECCPVCRSASSGSVQVFFS